jgi:hypothetical protein
MVVIIKRRNHDECFVAKMSNQGNPQGDPDYDRLIEIIDNIDLDKILYRKRLYRLLIDKLIASNRWNRHRGHQEGDVSNTMHDWIVSCFRHYKISKFFIEVDNDVFRPGY